MAHEVGGGDAITGEVYSRLELDVLRESQMSIALCGVGGDELEPTLGPLQLLRFGSEGRSINKHCETREESVWVGLPRNL